MEAEQAMARVAQRFSNNLAELNTIAGRPTYSALTPLSGHPLRRAAMRDVLNGMRLRVPYWHFVAAFVEACRATTQRGVICGVCRVVGDGEPA
jgi:hypothetical protein